MKPIAFEYHAAVDLEHALSLLNSLGEDVKVLAGGQSLGPMLNYRVARPVHLVDIGRIELFRHVAPTPNGGCRLGAGVTHSVIEDRLALPGTGDALPRVASSIAFRAIRNKGTIGGSLAHADPSADWPVVVSALDADIEIASLQGIRVVPARGFFLDQLETVLKPTDLIIAVHVPAVQPGASFGYAKISRKSGEFASSLACAVIKFSSNQNIDAADVWLGASASIPRRLKLIEERLIGSKWNDTFRPEIHRAVLHSLPVAGSEYERHRNQMHCIGVTRAIDDAYERRRPQ